MLPLPFLYVTHSISEELPAPIKNHILCDIPLVLEGHNQPWFPQLSILESKTSQVYSFKGRQEGEVTSNPSGTHSPGSQKQTLQCS